MQPIRSGFERSTTSGDPLTTDLCHAMMMCMSTAAHAGPGYELLHKCYRDVKGACEHATCPRHGKPFQRMSDWWWHLAIEHPGSVTHYNISQRLFKLNPDSPHE